MVKKLDILILKSFIGPFIATFFITLLVLLLQFFWLYIDDFVGKGIEFPVLLKFIWYQLAVLVIPALPLSILLSSLMTFGNMGEHFELAAIKSAGISLLRFMRPVFIFSLFVAFLAFLFTNYVMPVAFLKSRTLLSDIVFAKPAFDIQEGVFYDRIDGFVLKVGKKSDDDSTLQDIILYEHSNSLQDNFIIAKSGVMKKSADNRYLDFVLRDGRRYQEKGNYNNTGSHPDFIRLGFKEYKTQFDISSLIMNQTPDSNNKNSITMLNMGQLNVVIDSVKKELKTNGGKERENILAQMSFRPYLDSFKNDRKITIDKDLNFNSLFPDSIKAELYQSSINNIRAVHANYSSYATINKEKQRNLQVHKIEWHKKLIAPLACLVLLFIGAPLGSIIRKGGLGLPLIISILFFMIFYFSSTVGEKVSKEDKLQPYIGMWLPIYILLPIGIFLSYQAMNDSPILSEEKYTRLLKLIRSKLPFGKAQKTSAR